MVGSKPGDHGYLALYQRHPRTCQPSFPGQLTAKLLAVRYPSDDRMSVQASPPIHTAALRAFRTKKEPEVYSPLTLICAECLADGIKIALYPLKGTRLKKYIFDYPDCYAVFLPA